MEEERTTGVLVRMATDADLPHIERLIASGKRLSIGTVARAEGTLVAEVAGEMAGVIALEMFGSDGLVRAASVAAESRGRDVGRVLVESVLTEAALEAADAIYLFSEGADRFFARFGFVALPVGDVPAIVRRGVETNGSVPQGATPMRLPLVEH